MEENDDDADPTRQKQINRIKESFLHSSLIIILYDSYDSGLLRIHQSELHSGTDCILKLVEDRNVSWVSHINIHWNR